MSHPFVTIVCGLCAVLGVAGTVGAASPDREWSQQARFEIKADDGTYRAEAKVTLTITFLTERSTRNVVVPIPEDPHAPVDEVKALLNGKKLRHEVDVHYPRTRDVFFNEAREWLVTPEAGQIDPGDVLTVTYEVTYEDLAYLPLFIIPNDGNLISYELAFAHPKDATVSFDVLSLDAGPLPAITRADPGLTVLQVDSIPSRSTLPLYPFDAQHGLVLATVCVGDAEPTPTDPARFCRWYLARLDAIDATLPEVLPPALADSLDRATEPTAKLALIDDFVRQNIRYVQDAALGHRFIPSAPASVLTNRFGDCKDRAFLVQALARRVGVDVRLALVSRWPHVSFPARTNLYLYDHVIDAYADGERWLLFDPTGRHVPFGELPGSLAGREVLILDASAPVRFTIPAPDAPADLEVSIAADADDLASGQATVTLRGAAFHAAAEILDQIREPIRLQNALDRFVAGELYKIKLDDYEIVAHRNDAMVLAARADLSKFVVASTQRSYLPRIPFAGASREVFERADDDLPVYLDGRQAERLTVRLHAPDIVVAADSTRVGQPEIALYTADLRPIAGDGVLLEYTLRRQTQVFTGPAKSQYLDFCREFLASKRQLFTLDRGSP